jgi:hypothetical protein
MLGGILAADRLVEQVPSSSATTESQPSTSARGHPRNLERLQLGKRIGQIARRDPPAISESFAEASSTCAATASCGTPAASSIARRDALCEARTRPVIHASFSRNVRSLQSWMIAAAVSSIERRVTSITGQPLSANMRRA